MSRYKKMEITQGLIDHMTEFLAMVEKEEGHPCSCDACKDMRKDIQLYASQVRSD